MPLQGKSKPPAKPAVMIVQFALRGLGVGCVVGNFAEKHIATGELFEIRLSEPVQERSICVAYYDEASMSPAGRKLLTALIGGAPEKGIP